MDRLCGFCFGCCRLLHSRICKHGRKSTRSTTRGSCARSPWGQPAKRAPQGEVGALARISAICKLPVVPICRRRRRLQVRQIRIIFFDIPPQARGAHRDRHGARGGDAVDAKVLTDERRVRGRAKSCGPGAPMQALKLATMPGASWPATVANAGSPGRARISRKPLRREGRSVSACTYTLREGRGVIAAKCDVVLAKARIHYHRPSLTGNR